MDAGYSGDEASLGVHISLGRVPGYTSDSFLLRHILTGSSDGSSTKVPCYPCGKLRLGSKKVFGLGLPHLAVLGIVEVN